MSYYFFNKLLFLNLSRDEFICQKPTCTQLQFRHDSRVRMEVRRFSDDKHLRARLFYESFIVYNLALLKGPSFAG